MSKNNKFTQKEIESIMPIVAELAEAYTSKESSSISYDTAKQLIGAVLYCLQSNTEYQSIIPTEGTSYRQVKEAYTRGYESVRHQVRQSIKRYNRLIDSFKSYGNTCYDSTFKDALTGFFKLYEPRFDPVNTIITMDYPVLVQVHHLKGINAIEKYIAAIELEQHFLHQIPEETVSTALLNYHNDYESLIINIPSVILRQYFLGKVKSTAIGNIRVYLEGCSSKYLSQMCEEWLDDMLQTLEIDDHEIKDYLSSYINDFVTRLINFEFNH